MVKKVEAKGDLRESSACDMKWRRRYWNILLTSSSSCFLFFYFHCVNILCEEKESCVVDSVEKNEKIGVYALLLWVKTRKALRMKYEVSIVFYGSRKKVMWWFWCGEWKNVARSEMMECMLVLGQDLFEMWLLKFGERFYVLWMRGFMEFYGELYVWGSIIVWREMIICSDFGCLWWGCFSWRLWARVGAWFSWKVICN